MDIRHWFEIGRKRTLLEPATLGGRSIELGGGKNPVPNCNAYYDLPKWDADTMSIPEDDSSVHTIWMHGMIDYVEEPISLLEEVSRVLVWGGIANIIVPHAMSELGSSDILKKTHWTEESFPHLLENQHYRTGGEALDLKVYTQFIMGVVWRNLSLFVQLKKV